MGKNILDHTMILSVIKLKDNVIIAFKETNYMNTGLRLMVDKRHSNLLRDIKTYINQMKEANKMTSVSSS